MATFTKLPSGNWRCQVRRRGRYAAETFRRKKDADSWAPIEKQRSETNGADCIFPYNGKSVGAAFRRACRALDIMDLHFNDLRHEGTSRLFEAGLTIEQVALVTGNRDRKMLQRYTNLRPEKLHRMLQTDTAQLRSSGHRGINA